MSPVASPKHRRRAVVAVALALVAFEAAFRLVEERVSADAKHAADAPAAVARLSESEGPRLLVLGNSLVRDGVDRDRLRDRLADVSPVNVETLHPSASTVTDWRVLFERLVIPTEDSDRAAADVVVLGYAAEHLSDQAPVDPRRLGGYYVDHRTLTEVLWRDMRTLGDRVEVLAAYSLRTFAAADRLRLKTLAACVPAYEQTAERLNQVSSEPSRPGQAAGTARTYERLERLLDTARRHDVRVALVAFACGRPYELDPDLIELADEWNTPHLDLRHPPGVAAESFYDGYHMDPDAAAAFTDLLASRLHTAGLLE